jgi:hypothetical protein
MLERYSQSTIKEWAGRLLADLKDGDLPMPDGWQYSPLEDVAISISPGMLVIQWRTPEKEDRLKATFSYDDDGGSPLVSLIFDTHNVLQELEVWRGDGQSLAYAPTAADLEIPIELK